MTGFCSSTADDTPTTLDGLLAQLESGLNMALNTFGPILGLTDDQIKAAEADIDTLIKDIEAAEHGHTDIDTAIEKVVTDLMNLLKDFGLPVLRTSYGATSKYSNIKIKVLEANYASLYSRRTLQIRQHNATFFI